MPAAYVRDDRSWIDAQLSTLPPNIRERIAGEYTKVWQAAFDAEPVSFRQENRARHEANTRLRLFVETHGRAMQGYTSEHRDPRGVVVHVTGYDREKSQVIFLRAGYGHECMRPARQFQQFF